MQLIFARKTVVNRRIQDPANSLFVPSEEKSPSGNSISIYMCSYICVA